MISLTSVEKFSHCNDWYANILHFVLVLGCFWSLLFCFSLSVPFKWCVGTRIWGCLQSELCWAFSTERTLSWAKSRKFWARSAQIMFCKGILFPFVDGSQKMPKLQFGAASPFLMSPSTWGFLVPLCCSDWVISIGLWSRAEAPSSAVSLVLSIPLSGLKFYPWYLPVWKFSLGFPVYFLFAHAF